MVSAQGEKGYHRCFHCCRCFASYSVPLLEPAHAIAEQRRRSSFEQKVGFLVFRPLIYCKPLGVGFQERGFMKKINALIAVGILGALLAVCLAGCGGSGSASASASGSASSAAASEPVYLVSKRTMYDNNGNVAFVTEYTYDDQGRSLKVHSTSPANEGNSGIDQTREYSDFTPEGRYQKVTSSDGQEWTYTYTVENGQVTKSENSAGETSEYEYYGNGTPKRYTTTSENGETIIEFDENGYQTSSVLTPKKEGFYGGETVFEWTFDEAGKPVSCIRETTSTMPGNGQTNREEFTIACDDEGNIVKITNSDGNVVSELEYVKIDNPIETLRHGMTKSF